MDWVTVIFLVAGVLLIASEAVHLSLIPVFLGMAALVVAGLRGIGLVESVPMSLLLWSLTSIGLALPLRPLARRFLKAGDAKYDRSDEDKDAMGLVVEIAEDVDDSGSTGRIRFRGTTWAAQSTEGKIPAGGRAKLVYKDKLVWIVEPLGILDEDTRVPVLEAVLEEDAVSKVKG